MQADDIRDGQKLQMIDLLKLMVDSGASDLHLKVASPPVLRVDGVLNRLTDWEPLTREDLESAFEQTSTQ